MMFFLCLVHSRDFEPEELLVPVAMAFLIFTQGPTEARVLSLVKASVTPCSAVSLSAAVPL
jgi:hypothetical protein